MRILEKYVFILRSWAELFLKISLKKLYHKKEFDKNFRNGPFLLKLCFRFAIFCYYLAYMKIFKIAVARFDQQWTLYENVLETNVYAGNFKFIKIFLSRNAIVSNNYVSATSYVNFCSRKSSFANNKNPFLHRANKFQLLHLLLCIASMAWTPLQNEFTSTVLCVCPWFSWKWLAFG